jgi:hypothetical protein
MPSQFEDLPNDVIYEIFDYLDVCRLFAVFSPLNSRFEQLFVRFPSALNINLSMMSKRDFQRCCASLVRPNLTRLVSVRLSNPLTLDLFVVGFPFDESFIRLEALVFNQIESTTLKRLVTSLILLPRLVSLTMNNYAELDDSTDIYRRVFGLPNLKHCVLSPKSTSRSFALPIAERASSPIEYLTWNRHCSLVQLTAVLSYLPRLHHLSCLSVTEHNCSRSEATVRFPRLTHFAVKQWRISFDTLRHVSSKYFSHIEMLRLSTRADDHYLLADRWEQLIVNEMPLLRVFDFQHYWEPVDNDQVEQRTYHTLIQRFTSSFWTDRHWFFAHQHFSRRAIRDAVFYSTHPYRYGHTAHLPNVRSSTVFVRLDEISMSYTNVRTAMRVCARIAASTWHVVSTSTTIGQRPTVHCSSATPPSCACGAKAHEATSRSSPISVTCSTSAS